MPKYKCHKEVWALKIKSVSVQPGEEGPSGATITPEDSGYAPFEVDAEFYLKHQPKAGGYYVVYKDGYKSFSPAKAFEDGYVRKDNRLDNALYCNEKRKKMLWRRDRRLDDGHDPYTTEELLRMYSPYLTEWSHEDMSPREVRLLETLIHAIA